jgi:hypothetical protein
MSWVKLDDQFFTHPKVQRAGRDARDLFLVGLTYCANHRTDGIVPAEALPLLAFMAGIPDGEAAARKLVEVHLWEEGATGYAVHQYLEYNPSREKIEETRQHRAEAGSKGGKAAHSKREAICSDFASAGLDTDVEQKSTPSPVPVPVPDPVPVPEPRSSADADGGAGAPPPRAVSWEAGAEPRGACPGEATTGGGEAPARPLRECVGDQSAACGHLGAGAQGILCRLVESLA